MKPRGAAWARGQKKKALRLIESGRQHEALPLLQAVCRAAPGDGEAWMMLGAAQGALGHAAAAIPCLEQAAEHMPDNPAVLDNLALACQQAGDPAGAARALERCLTLRPGHLDTLARLARLELSLGRLEQAAGHYGACLEQQPDNTAFLTALGNVREFQGELSAAEGFYRRAHALKPDQPGLASNLANVLSAQGLVREALALYRRALDADPGNGIARSNYLLNLHYDVDLDARAIFEEHLARTCGMGAGGEAAPADTRFATPDAGKREGLPRLGFVSPDLRNHSVACFFEPLLESLVRSGVDCFCYADVARPDPVTRRLQALGAHWRDVSGQEIGALQRRIGADGVGVLVDLAGHTSARNMDLFARRAAPVQLTWLGYPDTTGLASMDFRLVDRVTDPDEDGLCSETRIRMDGCFLCYRAPPDAPPVSELPARRNGHVTFGSFNNLAKLNDRVLASWAGLLRRVPAARLYIKNPSLSDASTRERLRSCLVGLGVDAGRIELVGRTAQTRDHLALYRHVDIALDSFPYNGTTTTCEALWMGVPVVTLAGKSHMARVGASLLNAVGFPQWVADCEEAYIGTAAELARDLGALAALRSGLREHMRASALCDAGSFGQRFLAALEQALSRLSGGAG